MALEDIKEKLERRFDEPFKEFYKRRIIFWNDEEGEFKEEVKELSLSNAKVLILEERNQFECKRILSSEDETSNYLVYNPIVSDPEHDWFLDIKLYSEEYRADKTSRLMDEMQIDKTTELRNVVHEYKEFFNAASRREAVRPEEGEIEKKSTLYLSILSVICGTKERSVEAIIRAVLSDGLDLENDTKIRLLKYSASDLFWRMIANATGFNASNNIDELASHIVLSAMSRTMSSTVLAGLESKYSEAYSGFCYDLISNWTHEKDKEAYKDVAIHVTNELSLRDRLSKFDLDKLIDTDVIPVIDEVVLTKLMHGILENNMNKSEIMHIVEKRRTSVWYEDYDYFYEGIYTVMKMNEFEETHANSFHHVKASDMWDAYTKDYYQMDVLYREFHLSFSKSLNTYIEASHLNDLFKDIDNYVEREYKNWYLDNLSFNWNKVIEKDLSTTGVIQGIDPEIKQQTNFYKDLIKDSNNKIFVIISDALRYDVAYSLKRQLELETTADVEINARQAIFPTITKFGMAALLPHKKLSVENKNGDIKVLVDGHTSEMDDRDAILKAKNENSVAIKYKDLIAMKRDDRRSCVKGKDVVYIYHDTIDASSHNEEETVFDACEKAINELKNLVNLICIDLNGLNVIITSDHGFLYNYEELTESDKMDRSPFKKDIIEQGRRYVLTEDIEDPDFLMPVKGIYNEANINGYAPRENIRIKVKGSGGKFVHGGVSLQEMCVPVITYKYIRTGYKAYKKDKDKYDAKPVSVALLSSNHKISNMIFNLNFYQKEPVQDNYIACTYIAYIEDSVGNVVSDKQKIIANKTSTVVKDREFKCTFNLKSQKYSHTEDYYLVIVDEERKQIPIKEEVQIDIAMAIDEFDFFG